MSVDKTASSFADLQPAAAVLHGHSMSGEGDVPLEGVTNFLRIIKRNLEANGRELQAQIEKLVSPGMATQMTPSAAQAMTLLRRIINNYLKMPTTDTELGDLVGTFGIAGNQDPEVAWIINPVKGKKTLPLFLGALDAIMNFKEGDAGSTKHVDQSLVAFANGFQETKASPKWGVRSASELVAAMDDLAGKLVDKLAARVDVVANTVEKGIVTKSAANPEKVLAENPVQEKVAMSTKNFEILKQAHEMQAQAYELLGKAASMLTACDCGSSCVGDPAPAQIVSPAAPGVVVTTQGEPIAPAAPEGEVLVLKLAEKTACLAQLDKVAAELDAEEDEEKKKLAAEVRQIASALDKSAKVLEDGYDTHGIDNIRLVNEMETSYHAGVHEKGTQGEQSSKAVDSFKTDISAEVQNLPFLKVQK